MVPGAGVDFVEKRNVPPLLPQVPAGIRNSDLSARVLACVACSGCLLAAGRRYGGREPLIFARIRVKDETGNFFCLFFGTSGCNFGTSCSLTPVKFINPFKASY